MLIDSSPSQEVRTSSAPDDTGKWTITVDQVKDAATTPRQRLIVSIDANGAVLLHELFNAERDSIATFTPPLRLLPANIQVASTASDTPSTSDEYRPLGDSKVRIVEGTGSKASTRTGTSRAFVQATLASASADAQGLSVSVSTRLDIAVGPARIRRQSTYNLIPAHANPSGWTIQAESRDFSVRVGPITIERERSSLTGAINNP